MTIPEDGISDETAMIAARVRREAARLPGPDGIRDLAEQAVRHGGAGMSSEDVRELADKAIERAEQVTELLRELSALLGDVPEPGGRDG